MTFNLSEFKRLAGKRSKGEWWSDESSSFKFSVKNDTDILSNDSNKNDAEFTVYCGNHADTIIERIEKLEKVVAALRWYFEIDESEMKYFNPKYFPAYHAGKEALKALKERGE